MVVSNSLPQPIDKVAQKIIQRVVRTLIALVARKRAWESQVAEIYNKEVSRLEKMASRMLNSPEDGQDVVADVFRKLYQSGGTDIRNVAALLYTSVRHSCISELRKRRTRAGWDGPIAYLGDLQFEVASKQPGQEDIFLEEEERQEIWAFIDKLPNDQREVIVLRFYTALSIEETADLLQCTVSHVKYLAKKAYRALKPLLASQRKD